MALLSLIFGRPKNAQIGVLVLDASLSETHERNSQVTQSPIEDGSNVSDHATLEPISVSIEGFVSDAPIGFLNAALGTIAGTSASAVQNAFGGIGQASSTAGAIGGLGTSLGLGSVGRLVSESVNRTPLSSKEVSSRTPRGAFKYLEELWSKREPFKIITGLTEYKNMMITSLNIPRSAEVGKNFRFTLTAQQVEIVKSELIEVPLSITENQSASSNVNLGKQQAKERNNFFANFFDGDSKLLPIAQVWGLAPNPVPPGIFQ